MLVCNGQAKCICDCLLKIIEFVFWNNIRRTVGVSMTPVTDCTAASVKTLLESGPSSQITIVGKQRKFTA